MAEWKRAHEAEMAAERLKVIEEAKARMLAEEKNVQALRKHQVGQMAQQMEVLLVPRLKDLMASAGGAGPGGDAPLGALRGAIRDVASRVLNADNSTVASEIERVEAFIPEAAAESQSRRRKRFALAAAAIAAGLAATAFSSQIRSLWERAFEDSGSRSSASLEADAIVASMRQREPFNPPQTDAYKDLYVDNVLYTAGYCQARLDPDFQKAWILELNRRFVDDLKLGENAIVTFASVEMSLISHLCEKRESIDGRFRGKHREDARARSRRSEPARGHGQRRNRLRQGSRF